jgi:tetratricopeptide (TPR) repeat protein
MKRGVEGTLSRRVFFAIGDAIMLKSLYDAFVSLFASSKEKDADTISVLPTHQRETAVTDVAQSYHAGLWAYEEDRFDDAVHAFQRVIHLDPSHVDAHNYLGSVFYLQGRNEDALASLNRAVALDPAHSESHLNLGLVYKEMGQKEQAIQMFKRYLALSPVNNDTAPYIREMIRELGG